MSIHILIWEARKKKNGDNDWWVMHPMNDAILAYCSTEKEADQVIAALNKLEAKLQ